MKTRILCAAALAVASGAAFTSTASAQDRNPPSGACCVNGTCVGTTSQECTRVGGRYAGDNTRCATLDCRQGGGNCDWNHDGSLDMNDLFSFLRGFFSGNGDFNGDGATNVQDIFGFVRCLLAGR